MSFAEKIAGLMARPGQDIVQKDDVPWWMKYGGRGLGTVAAVFAILFGLWNCVSIVFANVDCLLSGILQMIAGFLVMICEAPCCCMFIDFVQQLSATVENRPYWNKAAVYMGIAIPPILLCPGLGSIFGCGLIFATGVIYGMMALGKKASAEEMRSSAVATENSGTNATHSSGFKANLVENAAPLSFSGIPKFDSNV